MSIFVLSGKIILVAQGSAKRHVTDNKFHWITCTINRTLSTLKRAWVNTIVKLRCALFSFGVLHTCGEYHRWGVSERMNRLLCECHRWGVSALIKSLIVHLQWSLVYVIASGQEAKPRALHDLGWCGSDWEDLADTLARISSAVPLDQGANVAMWNTVPWQVSNPFQLAISQARELGDPLTTQILAQLVAPSLELSTLSFGLSKQFPWLRLARLFTCWSHARWVHRIGMLANSHLWHTICLWVF